MIRLTSPSGDPIVSPFLFRVATSAAVALVFGGTACAKESAPAATVADSGGGRASAASSPQDVGLTADQATRLQVATVMIAPFRPVITTTGTVAFNGDHSTQVLAPVSGPVTQILVSPGAYVRRGQALATVTSPDFAAATSAFRKALSTSRNLQRIADLDAQLFKNDAIARREMEQAQTDAASAAADRDAAAEQLRALGVDAAAVDAVRANRGAAAAAVIRAPLDGTVVEKLVTPGQLIQAGTTPVFTIADLSTVWVMANVFESELALVAAGESATITSGASPLPVTGQVAYVGSLVDPATRATMVRILAPNPRDVLKRDMLVNVSIRAAQARNALVLPASAVLRDDQNLPFVFIALPNNRFARRQVTLGSRTGDLYEVKSGLASGERIVSNGALFVQFAGSQ
jgi:cobalt-zinc-cadmium efflux system membrane fusion protein